MADELNMTLRPRDIGILATGFFHAGLMAGVFLSVILLGAHL